MGKLPEDASEILNHAKVCSLYTAFCEIIYLINSIC